ncbi:MAG TPA: adenylosuccinate synthase [Bacteroidales bacterium]|nr:adenylosuccinate synthase [Bacteroidales bacterium]
MANIDILLGLQWGDEGKGKIVDALTPEYDVITRFQGGPNAGHTLEFNKKKFILHTIPSGIFHGGKLNVIGNGLVIDPSVFKLEVESLKSEKFDIRERLLLSTKSHLILPTHRILDAAYEQSKGKLKIGSTLKGIGPAYTDKVSRNGLRVGDILRDNFIDLYNDQVNRHLSILDGYDLNYSLDEFEEGWFEGIELIKEFRIENTEYLLNYLLKDGKKILAEGAQGTLLDIDFGSYPYVTSSNTISAGACSGMGISPKTIGEIYGIFKAYCTRVGSGPFPTELDNNTGQQLRDRGFEYGSTTGRPRRCGWLDLPALKYSCMVNGVTRLFMTKADVLTGFDNINICTHYLIDGNVTEELPFDHSKSIEPIYTEIKGWKEEIGSVRKYDLLPGALKSYIELIEKETGIPVSLISVGPDREEAVFRS